ncbi:MAG: hypothetical protein ACJA2O_000784 [Candidatus Azotimanducaceae bacterium]|jgi:hypothetical protein
MDARFPGHVAYFISGHGYGHAVRSAQLINALTEVRFSIFSTIPREYFERELTCYFDYYCIELDSGCAQTDAFEIDIDRTFEQYAAIENQRDKKIAQCRDILCSKGVEFVIGDIVPLAFTIANQLGLPSLAISNFTWVEIYQEYVSKEPRFKQLILSIKEDYANASCYARLNPGLDQHPFERVEDVPLLCRNKAKSRQWLFEELNLDAGKKLCLIYIGQYGLSVTRWQNLCTYRGWQFVGIYPLENASDNYLHIELDGNNVKYSDLVANCDLILAKLGYGTVSESLYWNKSIAYPPREQFAEFQMLEMELSSSGLGVPISLGQLQSCDLDALLKQVETAIPRGNRSESAEENIIELIRHLYQSTR